MIENVSLSILWVVFLLWLLYRTNAVYEYIICNRFLFWISKPITMFGSLEYNIRHVLELTYTEFLLEYNNTFLIRLFSCPFCFGVWIAIPLCWWFGCLVWFPVVYLGGLFGYYLLKKGFKWIL